MNVCDLHTHVLPDVDDGAASLDQALEMLRNAVCSDVSALALTPHF
jgi:protein-tyrosine phosphatase